MPNSLHRSAIASPASHKLHPLVQRRTLLPRHNHSLPEGRKCYLCVRYDVLPMSPAAHVYLVHRSFDFRSTTVQKRCCSFHCFSVRTVDQMRVVIQGNARIRMAELSLCDLWSCARFEENC